MGATTSFAYKFIAALPANVTYILSAVVECSDGLAPSFGSASANSNQNTFAFVITGTLNPTTYTVTQLTATTYRVSASYLYVSGAGNIGIIKYPTNNNRTFKVTGYDLCPANAGTNLLAYQRVNTNTDYDTVGFPKYLKFDGVDDSLATNSIDFSATDEMTVWSGVRKLSDAGLGTVV